MYQGYVDPNDDWATRGVETLMNHPCLNSIIYGNMYNYYIICNVNGLSKIS